MFGTTHHQRPGLRYTAVIDTSDHTLVAIGTHSPALFLLAETMMDTECVPGVALSADAFATVERGPRSYPELSWIYPKWTFVKTNPEIITDDMRERAVFSELKMRSLSKVVAIINRLRAKIEPGFLLQETLYARKREQAQYLKDNGFDERFAIDAPLVAQYAEASNIPLKQASEEILLQAQLDSDYLARTESVRVALLNKVRRATTPAELDEIAATYRKYGTV